LNKSKIKIRESQKKNLPINKKKTGKEGVLMNGEKEGKATHLFQGGREKWELAIGCTGEI